ncbi:MAG: hypothetical protein L6R28_23055 [Planctomycetes bacterium]|nr:hypothetical protein [Planctomycetota bacterium]
MNDPVKTPGQPPTASPHAPPARGGIVPLAKFPFDGSRIFPALRKAYVAVLVLFLIGPLVVLFIVKVRAGVFDEFHAPDAKEQERLAGLMVSTVRTAALATALAVLFGVTVAVAIYRARGWTRRILGALFPIPLLLPPAVVTIAWTHLIGKRGIVAALWFHFTGVKELPLSMYGEFGTAWCLALCWFPLVTMPALVGLRSVGPLAGRAGAVYAGRWAVFRRIHVPLMLPYVSAGAVFVAWLALGDFEVPLVLLTNNFPMQIYGAIKSLEMGLALYLCAPMLAAGAAVLLLRQVLVRGQAAATIESRWRPDAPGGGHGGRGWSAAAWIVLGLATVMPVASLLHQTGNWATFQDGLRSAKAEILHSYRSALEGAAIMAALGAPCALLLLRLRGWRRTALSLLVFVPLMVPGTIHGLAWTQALLPTAPGRAVLGSHLVLSLSDAARFFPICVFLLAAAFAALHPRLLDAAKIAGAPPAMRWRKIWWPLTWTGFLAAFAIGFALSAGELNASILLSPVGYSTLPIRISSLLHFGKDEMLAGMCLAQVVIALAPFLAATALLDRTLEVRLG